LTLLLSYLICLRYPQVKPNEITTSPKIRISF